MSGRELSFWGWGHTDRFPDRAAREGLARMVHGLLGVTCDLRDTPRAEDIALRAPRVSLPSRLAHLGSTEPVDRLRHTHGKAFRDQLRGLGGDFSSAPDVVARPASEDDIAALLDHCASAGLAAIPFGGGTSVVGGVEAAVGGRSRGAISIDMGRFARVVEVDELSRAARIQAGATGPALEAALAGHGLSLRFYPQSFEHSTLGGWIATRAAGHFATMQTHIDDLVESVRMVTPAGVWESRRLPGSGAGPSPDRLVLGSEGILGIITEAWVRIRPRPRYRASASARFADLGQGLAALRALAQADLYPSNCRLLDGREAMMNQVSFDGRAVLLIGFESADHPLGPWLDRALAICRGLAGEVSEPRLTEMDGPRGAAADRWRSAFLDAPYLQSALISLGCVVDTFETACTWDRVASLDAAVRAAADDVMRRVCGGGVLSCRVTHVYPDGPAPYYTFVAPGRRGGELEQWAAIKAAVSDAILAAGGTITHHHAIGRVHRPWYDRQRPDLFARALAAVKRDLDPAGVLNPGVLLDPLDPVAAAP